MFKSPTYYSLLASFIVLFSFTSINFIHAQSRFSAGLTAGLNFAQVRNDGYAGYHKLGLHGGIKVVTRLNEKFDLHTELLFNQKGSYTDRRGQKIHRISLSYIEVPILISIKDWYQKRSEGKSFYRTRLMAGISYGRLISSSTEGFVMSTDGLPLEQYFRKNDLSLLAGVSIFINKSIGVHARYSYGVIPLSVDGIGEKFKEDILGRLNSYLVSLTLVYIIS